MHTGILLKNDDGETYILEKQYELYYNFTVDCFFSIQAAYPKYKEAREKSGQLSKEDRLHIHSFIFYSNSFVLYAALTLEAYINYYGARYLKLSNRLKNLRVRDKWKDYIKLKLDIDLDKETNEKISKIINLRNTLAHSNAEKVLLNTSDNGWEKNIQARLEVLDKGQFLFDLNSIFKRVFEFDESEKKDFENNHWLVDLEKTQD
ncbi:hypothetical protein I6F53_04075 [Pseudoalteromonas sp. SWN29]|uniref:hypothetical protein n=1 Tax=Pseudoalteromonas sp. SWN29 TaxID=2792064 RepID=UPI0018CDF7A2|nr:hypothetical protein [Pseudoalteromonas sp. SWN29]MBH0026156.1 hypothetical protein [Pseudoalteromonas sp. SWN29]